jgi:hypothetical protein
MEVTVKMENGKIERLKIGKVRIDPDFAAEFDMKFDKLASVNMLN